YSGKILKLGHGTFCAVDNIVKSKELIIYLTLDEQLLAAFELGDELRSSAKQMLTYCHQHNLKSSMLTGDHSSMSEEVCELLNIDHLQKGVTPQQKLQYIGKLQQQDKVMMVGDGINDAPVLAGAHVSVTLASGTDIAKNSADVILLGEDLTKLAVLHQMAKKTTDIIKQNLIWALGYNIIIVPLAVMGHVPPYVAVLGMSFSSLIVVSNSLRLLK
ncbi:MAG: HAD-IC family P-type ATPase, partial [Psychromonas sp.]